MNFWNPKRKLQVLIRTGWGKDSVSLTLNCLVLFFFLKERALSSWLRTSSTAKRFIFKHLTKCRLISDSKFLFGNSPTLPPYLFFLLTLPCLLFFPPFFFLSFFFFFFFFFLVLVIWPRITYIRTCWWYPLEKLPFGPLKKLIMARWNLL